jgi:fumarylacetoacetase
VIDATHDPALRSWVESANSPATDFPIQNLPFGIFRQHDAHGASRIGVAIGDRILDLTRCRAAGLLEEAPEAVQRACEASVLNPLMALGAAASSQLRHRLSAILRAGSPQRAEVLVPIGSVQLLMPAAIGGYTDFYASIHHATNVGGLFRPDNPLLPNYRHLPIAYHGRTSSLVISGTAVRRPFGQTKGADDPMPSFRPSSRLDYEAEVAALIGQGTKLGDPVPIDDAERHIFGLCLLNDWSARDIQAWESQPLGPFLAKNFATSLSPWVVTLDALAPFRLHPHSRSANDPPLLPYLKAQQDDRAGIDLTVEVYVRSARMRDEGVEPVRLSRGSFGDMYWTLAQMVAHHTSNGCNLSPGDLIGSGTVSGAEPSSHGCLLELTRGLQPVQLGRGEERTFLNDGDEVILRGFCERSGYVRVGFGECRGVVLPAVGAPAKSQ